MPAIGSFANHMRLTIGKKTEMETFVSAFKQVMA
jgi:histidinol-phosphate/aromatic aminotransferase/cobyric acid decarboxylase-like protein